MLLQKLLNVSFLNSNGLKISKIAELPASKLNAKVREYVAKKGVDSQASNSLKLAMLNFDENLFSSTISMFLTVGVNWSLVKERQKDSCKCWTLIFLSYWTA